MTWKSQWRNIPRQNCMNSAKVPDAIFHRGTKRTGRIWKTRSDRREKRKSGERKQKKERQKSNGVFKVIAWLALVSLFLIYAAAVGAGLYGYL